MQVGAEFARAALAQHGGDALIADLRKQMAEDNIIFDNKVHHPTPALIDTDGPILPFRRWAERFYYRGRPSASGLRPRPER